MSTNFPLRLLVGGNLTEAVLKEFLKEFHAATRWSSASPEDIDVNDFLDSDLRFSHDESDGDPGHFDDLLKLCQKWNLSYWFEAWSDGVQCPDEEFWEPGMKKPVRRPLTMDGDSYVTGKVLKEIVESYCVSTAELMRRLKEIMPVPDIHIPRFRVVDGHA